MKRFSLIVITLLALFTLGSCKRNKVTAKVEIDEHVIKRDSTSLTFTLKDPKKQITRATIEGRLYHKENLINRYTPQLVEGEQDQYKIAITNLSINHEYTLKIFAIANKRSTTLFDKTFMTKHEGSSASNPILISTVEQFMDLESDENAYYEIVEDLDFEGVEYTPIFQQRTFAGVLNGGGFSIKNLKIDKRSTYVALFGRNNGTIKNLVLDNVVIELLGTSQSSQYISLLTARNTGKIEDIDIVNSRISTGFSHSGVVRVGGVSAYSESGSKISNITGTMNYNITAISRTEFYLGGIAGELNGGSLEGSDIKTNVIINNSTTAYLGGAVGRMENSSIYRATANETKAELNINISTTIDRVVSNDKTVAISIGGFVGRALDTIVKDSYGKAKVTLKKAINAVEDQAQNDKIAIGGFVGSASNRSEFNNILATLDLDFGQEVTPNPAEEEATIKFDLGYSNDMLPNQTVDFGDVANEPLVPTRDGFEFRGWYLGNELYDFDTIVDKSLTLVAQWEDIISDYNKIQVSFDLDHKSERLKPILIETGDKVTKPKDPFRAGYKFDKWLLNDEEFDFDTELQYNIALKASWEKLNFSYIDLFYIGGIAGESFASTHDKNFALNISINAITDYGRYKINPTVGNDHTIGSYSGGDVIINGEDYANKTFEINDKVLVESIVLTPQDVSNFFTSEFINDILNK